MLQENAVTGVFFVAGIFYGSIEMGIAALISVVVGTITAQILKYPEEEICKGLYGFSAGLVGVALLLFFTNHILTWVAVVVGASLATILQHFFIRRKIAAFTLPFVLVTWALLYILYQVIPEQAAESAISEIPLSWRFPFLGYGQVIFQGSFIAGLLFFFGVLWNSRVAALFGLVGAIIAGLVAVALHVQAQDIALGLYSFNAVLCAIAFAGRKMENVVLAIGAVLLSLGVSYLMMKYQLVQLTFPFVVATMATLLVQQKYYSRNI